LKKGGGNALAPWGGSAMGWGGDFHWEEGLPGQKKAGKQVEEKKSNLEACARKERDRGTQGLCKGGYKGWEKIKNRKPSNMQDYGVGQKGKSNVQHSEISQRII